MIRFTLKLTAAFLAVSLLALLDGEWEAGAEPQVRSRGGRFESDQRQPSLDLGGSDFSRQRASQGDSTALLWEIQTNGGD